MGGVQTDDAGADVLGISVERMAGAFLQKPATLGQRLTRAKAKIRDARIPFEVPADDALPARLGAVLDAIYGAYGLDWAAPGGADLAPSHLLQRFEALLDLHFRQHWRVADYARALAVTPTHLSRVARTATGAPASRLIDARLVREAQRQLAFTGLGVATIADTLGFVDPALFSRVFSRVTGCSPRTYRHRLEASRASPPAA